MPQQFENLANKEIHTKTTAVELLKDMDNKIDVFVAGVGTGGTISGVGKKLKQICPSVKIVAVEPADSPVLSGGKASKHALQGIGAGFVPKIYDETIVDEIIQVTTEQAYNCSREVAKSEGLLIGISSGASLHAAEILSKKLDNSDENIVVIFPDNGERYLSTGLYS